MTAFAWLSVGVPALPQQMSTSTCHAELEPRTRKFCDESKDNVLGPPLRTLGWLCGPRQEHCKGKFPVEAGSGGATVVAFYTHVRKTTAKTVRVDWTCPDGQNAQQVSITLRVNTQTWQQMIQCGTEHYDFPLKELHGWERGRAGVLVRLLAGKRCTLPVYFTAHLTTPEGYFKPRVGVCRELTESEACLVVYANFSLPDGWQIQAGEAKLSGIGLMGETNLRLSKPNDCHPIDLAVDFAEREIQRSPSDRAASQEGAPERRTLIAELRF